MITNAVRKIIPSYGYSIPTKEEVFAELARTRFTPDIAVLEENEWCSIFVSDELKKDHFKHHLLGEAKYCFPAYTQKTFLYWESNNPTEGAIPFECENVQKLVVGWPPAAKIKGEVYLIRPQQFLTLDEYKQNTVEYRRENIRLIVPYRRVKKLKDLYGPEGDKFYQDNTQLQNTKTFTSEERVYIVRAWFYVGEERYWDPRITAYDYGQVETFSANYKRRQWLDQYYHIRRPQLPPKL